jgi:hypothetical protein
MTMNVDMKLQRMATAYYNSKLYAQNRKGAQYRAMVLGRAQKLIEKAYPVNAEVIWREWQKLAGVYE